MQPADKRNALRRTVKYPASIDLGDGSIPRECALCDASEAGAQLFVADPVSLPNKFTLILGYDGTARRRCRVVWRTETQVGVEFMKLPGGVNVRSLRPAGRNGDDKSDGAFDIETFFTR